MTIAELEKKYPYKKYQWIARLKGWPNWNYKPEDIVIDYEEREVESTPLRISESGAIINLSPSR